MASTHDLITHPQLRTKPMQVHGCTVEVPAAPYVVDWGDQEFAAAPEVGRHALLPEGKGS